MNKQQTKLATQLIRQIIGTKQYLFNDRLSDGRRSYKVGLQSMRAGDSVNQHKHEAIKFALWTAGFKVTDHVHKGTVRLHVAAGVAK